MIQRPLTIALAGLVGALAATSLAATSLAASPISLSQPEETIMIDAVTPAGDADTARIIATVSSIPLAVDLARYDLAEAAFAPSIVIDYTSLWGGEPQTMTPAALMDAWRALVPGFDATRHELRDVTATVTGDRATATASVDARHWIDGKLWRPIGRYNWTLERRQGAWKVKTMMLVMSAEIGDRGLVAIATERAKLR